MPALANQVCAGVCVIVSIDWRPPAIAGLPVFYKQLLLPKIRVLLQKGVSKVKCYTYHGNRVFYVMPVL